MGTKWKHLFKSNVCRFLQTPIWRDGDMSKDPEYIVFGNAGSGVVSKDARRGYGYHGTNDDQEATALLDALSTLYKRTNKKPYYKVTKQTKQVEVEVEVGGDEDTSDVKKKEEVVAVCPECGKEYTGKTAKANLKQHMGLKHN